MYQTELVRRLARGTGLNQQVVRHVLGMHLNVIRVTLME
jgi:sensor histidine kinase YesM